MGKIALTLILNTSAAAGLYARQNVPMNPPTILITLYGSNVKMEIFSFPIQTLGRSKCLELSAVNRPHMDDLGLKQKCRGYLHTDLHC